MTAGPGEGAAVRSVRFVTPAEEQAWNAGQLVERVRAALCRIWIYEESAFVAGRSQRDLERRMLASGATVLRRDSGGGVVAAGPWLLGVSVVLPPGHPLAPPALVKSYQWFGEAHARALRRLGIPARATPPPEVDSGREQALSWACFGSLSHWEVAVASGRRKIVGLAQVRRQTGVLFVGGTLVSRPDWAALVRTAGARPEDAERLDERTADCESLLGRPVPPLELGALIDDELRAALSSSG